MSSCEHTEINKFYNVILTSLFFARISSPIMTLFCCVPFLCESLTITSVNQTVWPHLNKGQTDYIQLLGAMFLICFLFASFLCRWPCRASWRVTHVAVLSFMSPQTNEFACHVNSCCHCSPLASSNINDWLILSPDRPTDPDLGSRLILPKQCDQHGSGLQTAESDK